MSTCPAATQETRLGDTEDKSSEDKNKKSVGDFVSYGRLSSTGGTNEPILLVGVSSWSLKKLNLESNKNDDFIFRDRDKPMVHA